jgi:tetratricopeptide (TPR) repeat protein
MTITATLAPEIAAELPPEPYPGLRPFEPGEWAIFFGREPMTDEVLSRLARQHLVVVHGASGSGKSSLVRAGVLPWLNLDHARSGKAWKTAITRPSGGPLRNIASELAAHLGTPPDAEASADAPAHWHDRLALGSAVLTDIDRALVSQGGASFCLLIDQFEELFRYAREQSTEEARLLTEILNAVADPERAPRGLFVLLTMRSDYLGACARFEGFAEAVNGSQYLLPRLDDFALLRAIHEPATLYGGQVDPAVGARLLFATREEEDALPILQHTLMRACAQARHGSNNDGWVVTQADLQAIEGEHGALSDHADSVLAEVTTNHPERFAAAEWLFRSLTSLDAEGRVIRRPRRLDDLVAVAGGDRAAVAAIIEAFRGPERSFLTPYPPQPLEDNTEIDVSHEALIRRWHRLSDRSRDSTSSQRAGWLWREFEDGQRWRALVVQAQAFRDDSSATLSPATTEAYLPWWPKHTAAWATRYASNREDAAAEYQDVAALWEASKVALEQERTRLERERRLRKRAQLGTCIALGLLALTLIALTGIAWFYHEASAQRYIAERNYRLAIDQAAGSTDMLNRGFKEGAINSRLMAELVRRGQETVSNLPGTSDEVSAARAKLLIAMSPAMTAIGETGRAQEYADAAIAIVDDLVRHEPSRFEWHILGAESRAALGVALFWAGEDATVAREKTALAIAEFKRLVAIAPDNALITEKLIACYETLGDASRSLGDFEGATTAYNEWLKVAEALAERTSDRAQADFWRSYAADAHLHLGDLLQQQKRYGEAATQYRAGLAIAARINADEPGNAQYLEHLSLGHGKLGDALIAGNDLQDAVKEIDLNISLTDVLVKDLSANIRWLIYQNWSHFRKGRALLALQRYGEAYREFTLYLQGVEGMRKRNPGYVSALYDASNAHQWMGDALRLDGRKDDASGEYEEALRLALDTVRKSPPTNHAARKILAMAYYRLGLEREAQGRRDDAASNYRECAAVEFNHNTFTARSNWPEDVTATCQNKLAELGGGTKH